MSNTRQYDIVLFGATGYTGKLTAEHITTHLPTDIKWAIAGRSASKLEALAAECKALNPDRSQPSIEVASLDFAEVDALAKKTTLMIATIGPYAKYGEPAFKACAENGTHYIDTTGEVAWVALMIKKYGDLAKKNNCIMVPQCGFEAALAEISVWAMANHAREKYNKPIGDTILSVHEMKGGISGGTLATVLDMFESFPLKDIAATGAPYGISPIPGPAVKSKAPWYTSILGIRNVPDLGTLTTSPSAASNVPSIQRTWGLLQGTSQAYGNNFFVIEYMKARNAFLGFVQHFVLTILMIALLLKPVRSLLARIVTAPGDGPSKESTKQNRVEYRGTAEVEGEGKVFVRAQYDGGLYYLTGFLLGEAAITVLRDESMAKELRGIVTPACLGQAYVDHLCSTSFFKLDVKMLKN